MSPGHAFRRLRSDRGAAAVEFAMIAVPLALLLVGTVDFGRALYTRNNMIEAADVGARVILLDNAAADADVTASIRNAFIAGPDGNLAVTLGTASENGIDFRTIALAYDFDLLTPLLMLDQVTMQHSRRVPLE